MRSLHLALVSLVLPAALNALGACGGDDSQAAPDASLEAQGMDTTLPPPDVPTPPLPDSSVRNCTLGGNNMGLDPVGLCVQKLVLQGVHGEYSPEAGVPASWDSTSFLPDSDDAGAPLHDFHDDVGYAAASALYHQTSSLYGDTELTPQLDVDLAAMAPLLTGEVGGPPSEYSGELYLRLRTVAGGLRYVNQNAAADAIDTAADAYGRAIFTQHFFPTQSPDAGSGDAGGGDAGPEAGLEAGASDGAAPDAGVDAGGCDGGGVVIADAIIGTMTASGVAYAPDEVATAALALLDLAQRNPGDPNVTAWQLASLSALEHIRNRAREATTGLYYRSLVTSLDPGHDRLDPTPPSDVLLSDVQAVMALALVRAADLVSKNASLLCTAAGYPFQARADEISAALNGPVGLWDGPPGNQDAGPTDQPGALQEGYIPSTQTLLTTKTMRSNVYYLAVLHRSNIVDGPQGGSPYASEINPLRYAMLTLAGAQQDVSFLSVLDPQLGVFRATTKSFQLASEPRGSSYRAAAAADFVEGMSELLYGVTP